MPVPTVSFGGTNPQNALRPDTDQDKALSTIACSPSDCMAYRCALAAEAAHRVHGLRERARDRVRGDTTCDMKSRATFKSVALRDGQQQGALCLFSDKRIIEDMSDSRKWFTQRAD